MEENLEKVEDTKIAELEAQIKNLKALMSEKNSENASKKREAEEWKNKYESTLSEQEKAEQARALKEAEREEQLNQLLREKNVSNFKSNFLSVGYDEELASSTAEAMVDGNNEAVFASLKTFIDNTKKHIEAESLKKQPELTTGKPPTKEDADKLEQDKLRHYMGLK